LNLPTESGVAIVRVLSRDTLIKSYTRKYWIICCLCWWFDCVVGAI